MATSTASRLKLWAGTAAAAIVILSVAAAWPGGDDDAINRDQEDSERRREAVVKADFASEESFIDWGKAGAITRTDNPKVPFERVVEVQRGDRVSIRVQTKSFDGGQTCSITVNGEMYAGKAWGYGCEAWANVR